MVWPVESPKTVISIGATLYSRYKINCQINQNTSHRKVILRAQMSHISRNDFFKMMSSLIDLFGRISRKSLIILGTIKAQEYDNVQYGFFSITVIKNLKNSKGYLCNTLYFFLLSATRFVMLLMLITYFALILFYIHYFLCILSVCCYSN